MPRVHVSAQELSEEEQQTLLNGPAEEQHALPDGRTIYYSGDDRDITQGQSDAIAAAWEAGQITGFGVGQ